jgi:hypothetical protein
MNGKTIITAIGIIGIASLMLWSGCGKMTGEQIGNQPPTVRFVNVPVNGDTFNYAPIVYWMGDDPDGFVEYYSYIDDTTAASRNDPVGFIQNVDPARWVDTVGTQAIIYLLTSEGDTTEHTFFIRSTDDDGAHSVFNPAQHIRTYYRTNQAPNTPVIKWEEWPDDSFSTTNVMPDTLFCIDSTTSNWGGIGFIWKSNDPDDRELNIIPLQFTYILVDEDSNIVQRWSLADTTYEDTKNLTVYDLDTGWYTLYVWCRDDGFTVCHSPGHISFYVIRPEFDRHILMYDETPDEYGTIQTIGNYNGLLVDQYYLDILQQVHDAESQLVPDARFVLDSTDVMFFHNSNPNNYHPLPYDLIHHYKLVIMYSENRVPSRDAFPDQITYRSKIFSDYMNIGGNVWIIGRRLLLSSFGLSAGEKNQSQMPSLLVDYFGLSGGYASNLVLSNSNSIEFVGAYPAVVGFPQLAMDTTKIPAPPFPQVKAISEVDALSRRILTTGSFYNYAFTTYYYNSRLAGDTSLVYNENSKVLVDSLGYPAPTTTDCYVRTNHGGLMQVFRVDNLTKNSQGEVIYFETNVIRVSYEVGTPWEGTDTLSVDYQYNPYSSSQFHLQPCGVFKIAISSNFDFLYRAAINSFPIYPLDNSEHQVRDMFIQILNVFFSPYL